MSTLRLAYFSPLPPARSGIADYSLELLPYLAQHAQIALYADDPQSVTPFLRDQFPVYPSASYASRRWQHDIALYQMGNSMHHDSMYRALLRYPGIVVLHDYGLHHFVAHRTISVQNNLAAFVREMGFARGQAGVLWARDIRDGLTSHPLAQVPLNERLLAASLGLIVHSQYVSDTVARQAPCLPTRVIPAPIQAYASGRTRRSDLGLPPDAVVIASVGQITPAKRVDRALEAFARLRQFPHVFYLLAGECTDGVDLPALIRGLDLKDRVKYIGFVDDLNDLCDWISAADIVVNLRNPTVGETSAIALRALAAGRPLIVFDHGWYSELPDDVCIAVPPDDVSALSAAMERLSADARLRSRMGEQAARYAAEIHSPSRAAQAYADFIQGVLDGLTGRPASEIHE